MGVCTFLVTPGLYALLAVGLGQQHAVLALLLCVAYGAARGSTIALFSIGESKNESKGEAAQPRRVGSLEFALRVPLVAAIAGAVSAQIAQSI